MAKLDLSRFRGRTGRRLLLWAGLVGAAGAYACASDDAETPKLTLDGGALDASGAETSTDGGSPVDGGGTLDAATPDASSDAPTDAVGDATTEAASDAASDAPTDATGDSGADADAACTVTGLHFAAATDGVAVSTDGGLNWGAATTVEMWVYEDATADGGPPPSGTLFNEWTFSQEDKYLAGGPSLYAYLHVPPSTPVSIGDAAAKTPVAQWVHVALVHDATSSRIYQNGVKVAESVATTTVANSTGPIQIGHVSRDYQSPPVVGFYSEVRQSSVARYTATFTPAKHLTADVDTQAFWKFDEGSGTTANDSAGGAHHGVITGATWAPVPCR